MDKKKNMLGNVTFTGNVTFNGPMFDIHDNENVFISSGKPQEKTDNADETHQTATDIPVVLKSEEAEEMMEDLVDAGLLDEEWQTVNLSGTEQALVAKAVSGKLDIKDVWQVFGSLWSVKPETLRTYFNRALEQKKSLSFQEKLKNILD